MKKKAFIITLFVLLMAIACYFGGKYYYANYHGYEKLFTLSLLGDKDIVLEVGEDFEDGGAKAFYDGKNVDVSSSGKVDTTKVGDYKISYSSKHLKLFKTIERTVHVVDTTKPVLSLKGEKTVTYNVGTPYKEPGYSASDNYDGDLTSRVIVKNEIDYKKIGSYEISYTVKDSSGNEIEEKRTVIYKAKPVINSTQKVAVLNYHFFYDPSIGEVCNESICENVKDFRAQLDYLKNNGYKTLTMDEFRAWMYGEIDIPSKSVLITVDDGAMGTGKHNGNKLIPILEEYKMHATLFLITGWWDISNYQSPYLDVESHTNDMHLEGRCKGVTRGAQMLCSTKEQVMKDLKKSISITGSTNAFCFPFYAYNSSTIQSVKDAGFKLAFIGGNTKASRTVDKYKIPRYPIYKTTSLNQFIKIVS